MILDEFTSHLIRNAIDYCQLFVKQVSSARAAPTRCCVVGVLRRNTVLRAMQCCICLVRLAGFVDAAASRECARSRGDSPWRSVSICVTAVCICGSPSIFLFLSWEYLVSITSVFYHKPRRVP